MSAKITITIPDWVDRICAWPAMAYRKYKYGYSFRRINLGEGEWTVLDQEDYYRLNRYKWSATCSDEKIYAARIIRETKFGRITTMYLHRQLMNPPHGLLVDHKNGDSLDNRRANLRFATHSENSQNKRKKKNGTSRFLGVWWDKQRGLWESKISNHGGKIWLGRFVSEIDAAKAYDAAARKYHGEFARLNFS